MVILDLVARSWRIGIVLRALGSPITASASFTTTIFGDAVAALTPWRIGGEPARVFGAAQGGASATTAVIGLAIESLVTYAVLAVIGIALAVAFGAEWASLIHGSASWATVPQALAVAAIVVVIGAIVVHRLPPHIVQRARRFLADGAARLRRLRPRDIAMMSVLSAVSLLARIAILPIVVEAFGERAPIGPVSLASFALLNGQLLVPTPSGAGAVELAAAAGVIGTHDRTAAIVATWRLYVTVIPIVAGLLAAAISYGPRAVMTVFKRREVP